MLYQGGKRPSRAVQRTRRRRPVGGHTPVGLATAGGLAEIAAGVLGGEETRSKRFFFSTLFTPSPASYTQPCCPSPGPLASRRGSRLRRLGNHFRRAAGKPRRPPALPHAIGSAPTTTTAEIEVVAVRTSLPDP
jgi:hypothetical protein